VKSTSEEVREGPCLVRRAGRHGLVKETGGDVGSTRKWGGTGCLRAEKKMGRNHRRESKKGESSNRTQKNTDKGQKVIKEGGGGEPATGEEKMKGSSVVGN